LRRSAIAALKQREEHGGAKFFQVAACFYDVTRRAVRFWGYDGAIEMSFFVAADLLK
jgi:hypothetical protein